MCFHPFINFSLLVVTNLNLQLVRLAPALFVYLSRPRTHRPSRETKAFARVGIMSGCAVLCFQKTAPRQPARNDDRKLELLRSSACFFPTFTICLQFSSKPSKTGKQRCGCMILPASYPLASVWASSSSSY